MRSIVLALALACGASSCVVVPKASAEADAQAKSFETRPDMCGLYVYRTETLGNTVELELELDYVEFGATGSKNFLFAWLEPGRHTLASRTEQDSPLAIEAKAGTLVFVRQAARMGYWSAASKLQVVSEAEGRKGVLECALVEPLF
jgi:hypothetical protein